MKHYANYLQHLDQYNLNLACVPLHKQFQGVYLVGSVLSKPDWRDVDVRILIEDREWPAYEPRKHVLDAAMSEWLKARTGLPIDCQFQQITEANEKYGSHEHPRHALGFALDLG